MEGDSEKKTNNLEVEEDMRLIDISSEDDFLIASPIFDSLEDLRLSVNITPHEGYKLFGATGSLEAKYAADILAPKEHKFLLSKSMESARPSYMRKSLAWDSAFFTSEGVLDPNELSIINKGFMTAEAHLLTDIQEDVRMRRSDSESTLDSDGFSLESFELDLFEDIRASIHRSCCATANLKSTSKKVDVSSRKKVKSIPSSKKQSINLQGSERIKEGYIHPQIPQTARRVLSDSLSLKPPKTGRMNPTSVGQTKSSSSNAYKVQRENISTTIGSGHGSMVSKKYGLGDSRSHPPISTPPHKSSSLVSLIASKDSTVSCSSAGVSSSKSYSSSLRRKTHSRITKLVPTGSTSDTSVRSSIRNESRLRNSNSSINSSSLSNHSSRISPASSLDGWSLESLSSTSASNQERNNLEAGIDITTLTGICKGNDATQASDFQCLSPDPFSVFPNQCVEKALGIIPVSVGSTEKVLHSGLRMPSPKIGFFDEGKAVLPKVRESLQFHFGVQNAVPNVDVTATRKGQGKFQPAKIFPKTGKIKLGSQRTGVPNPESGIRPRYATDLRELDSSSKRSGTFVTTINGVNITSNARTATFPAMDRENCSKIRRVDAKENERRKGGVSSSLDAKGRRNKGILNYKTGIESKGKKYDIGVHCEIINSSKKDHEDNRQHHLADVLHHEIEKKTLASFEDQVSGLRKYFEVIDLNRDVPMELHGKKSYSHSQHGENYPKNCSTPVFAYFTEDKLCDQQKVSPNTLKNPSSLSVSITSEVLSTRTPLADKTSVYNRSELSMESPREKSVQKASIFPSPESKELPSI